MFWDKKKRSSAGLPELPSPKKAIPSMREFHDIVPSSEYKPEDDERTHSFPSFPDSPMTRGFSQSAIKDAVETDENADSGLPELPELPEEPSISGPPEKPRLVELEEWKPSRGKIAPKKPMPDKSIFVKLDKFEEAKKSLHVIREKINSLDEALKTIKEIKSKEEQEIDSWEKEIESVKARINSINSEIFENYYE